MTNIGKMTPPPTSVMPTSIILNFQYVILDKIWVLTIPNMLVLQFILVHLILGVFSTGLKPIIVSTDDINKFEREKMKKIRAMDHGKHIFPIL